MWLHQHQHKASSDIKMIQIKLNLVNLIQRREPTTHRWMVKRRFNYNNNVATLGPANFIVIYPLAALTLLSPWGNKIFSRVPDGIYPAASLVVVEVHHLASVVKSPWNLIGFSLADINEVLSKSRVLTNEIISNFAKSNSLVSIFDVVAAAAPDPGWLEVFGPLGPGAAAAGELAIPAAPGHRVHHTRAGHGVSEGGLLGGWNRDRSESGRGY